MHTRELVMSGKGHDAMLSSVYATEIWKALGLSSFPLSLPTHVHVCARVHCMWRSDALFTFIF